MNKIVAAAIRHQSGIVFSLERPARHFHIINLAVNSGLVKPPFSYGQGFLDARGQFVTREEALGIVKFSGQLTKPILGSILTSEDLW